VGTSHSRPFHCLSKTIAYGDGSSRRQLKHAVFFDSALQGEIKPPVMRVVVDFMQALA